MQAEWLVQDALVAEAGAAEGTQPALEAGVEAVAWLPSPSQLGQVQCAQSLGLPAQVRLSLGPSNNRSGQRNTLWAQC